MKKPFLTISILTAGFLIVPAFCLGAVTYLRTPAGYTIQNPVSFEVTFDTEEDFLAECPYPGFQNYWGLYFTYGETGELWTIALASTTLSYNFILNLPIADDYLTVSGMCADTPDFTLGTSFVATPFFERDDPNVIFEVVGKFFTLPENAIASTTNTVGDLVDAVFPFIAVFVGLPLGFYVVKKWLDFMPK